jgi:hypothetical protein
MQRNKWRGLNAGRRVSKQLAAGFAKGMARVTAVTLARLSLGTPLLQMQ